MRKQKIFSLLCLCLLVTITSVSCKKEEEKSEALSSLAENGINKTEVPKGCEIISNPAEYIPVTENQSYQFETDASNYQIICGLADVGTKMFYMSDNYLHYYDKEQNKSGLLCSKPDCTHIKEDAHTCSSMVYSGQGLTYVDGALYTITNEKIELVKISLDGTERTVVGKLCTVPEEDTVDRGQGAFSITWLIHRGYIYYNYELYSGMEEDTYYLNGSNCLYRMSIDGSGEPECILPFVCEGYSVSTIIKAYGSYVYLNVAEKGKNGGYLYRYNIESGKVEKLEPLGDDIRGYTVKDRKIYYSYFNEPDKIYCYNESTKESRLFLDIEEDEKHQSEPCLYSDNDNIYVPYTAGGGVTDGMTAFDWQGNKIADIPWTISKDEHWMIDQFCGMSNECIYFLRLKGGEGNPWQSNSDVYAVPCYIKKADLKNGDYKFYESEK